MKLENTPNFKINNADIPIYIFRTLYNLKNF